MLLVTLDRYKVHSTGIYMSVRFYFTLIPLFLLGCAVDVDYDTSGFIVAGIQRIDLDDLSLRKQIIAQAIDDDRLESKGDCCNEIMHAPQDDVPYTGWMKSTYSDGKIFILGQYKEGKENGCWYHWYPNGNKMEETIYQKGKVLESLVWKPDGIKCPDTNVVNGNGVAVSYDHQGKAYLRSIYKKGELITD